MGREDGVAAVERALLILDAMSEDRVSLAELTSRTGLVKSTVLRIAKSLEKFGYLLRSDEGFYRIGPKPYQIGCVYKRHYLSSEIVLPVLEHIVEELQEGASFYVLEGDTRICLHRLSATRVVHHLVQEGESLPLTVGAAGHVLRAFSGVRGSKFDEVRRNMFAASFGERDGESAAVASPVFGFDNALVGALSVSGPRYRIEDVGVGHILPVLFKYAKQLTKSMGGNIDAPEFSGWRRTLSGPVVGRRPVSRSPK